MNERIKLVISPSQATMPFVTGRGLEPGICPASQGRIAQCGTTAFAMLVHSTD
jgi:hypothetical protein